MDGRRKEGRIERSENRSVRVVGTRGPRVRFGVNPAGKDEAWFAHLGEGSRTHAVPSCSLQRSRIERWPPTSGRQNERCEPTVPGGHGPPPIA